MRVIVAKEKHDDRILDASTDEKWLESSMALLRERFEEGIWYWDPDVWDKDHPFVQKLRAQEAKLMEIPEEEIDEYPDEVVRAIKAVRARVESDQRDTERALKLIVYIRETLDGTKDPWVTLRNGKTEPRAWYILRRRRDAEYEYVELRDTE